MREKILFVGIGQCGSNIANEFEKLGYVSLCINTSYADLQAIKCKEIYHIPASKGCNKDRKKASRYCKEYWKTLANDVIDGRFPLQDIVYFCFSLGGGSGSGISPPLLKLLSQKNPHKSYGAIIVLPDLQESIKAIQNSLEAYKQLTSIEGLKALFVLDNSNEDKFKINKVFADRFNTILNMTNPDNRGVIDESELETVLTCKGNVVIEEWSNDTKNTFKTNIFTPYLSGAKYVAYYTVNKINHSDYRYKTGEPLDIFYGYNDKRNLFVASGMPYPKNRINDLIYRQGKKKDTRHQLNKVEYEIPSVIEEKKVVMTTKTKDIDIDDIFGDYV